MYMKELDIFRSTAVELIVNLSDDMKKTIQPQELIMKNSLYQVSNKEFMLYVPNEEKVNDLMITKDEKNDAFREAFSIFVSFMHKSIKFQGEIMTQ